MSNGVQEHPGETIFWDVDTQADFMLPGGRLYVAGAEQIIPKLARLTQYADSHGILVVSSTDAHQPDDAEFAQYPPHCLVGTPGQKKVAETQLNHVYVVPNAPTALPVSFEHVQQVVIEKQKLDVFSNPNTDELLRRLEPKEVVLYGVVTELCVQCAARGLLDRGYRVRLVTDAVRALDVAKSKDFMDEVQRRGGELVQTKEVTGRSPQRRDTAA